MIAIARSLKARPRTAGQEQAISRTILPSIRGDEDDDDDESSNCTEKRTAGEVREGRPIESGR